MTTGVRTWREKHLAFRVLTMETAPGSERVSWSARPPWLWEDSLVEAGQRGQQEPIRVPAALGSSRGQHRPTEQAVPALSRL